MSILSDEGKSGDSCPSNNRRIVSTRYFADIKCKWTSGTKLANQEEMVMEDQAGNLTSPCSPSLSKAACCSSRFTRFLPVSPIADELFRREYSQHYERFCVNAYLSPAQYQMLKAGQPVALGRPSFPLFVAPTLNVQTLIFEIAAGRLRWLAWTCVKISPAATCCAFAIVDAKADNKPCLPAELRQ